MKLPHWAQLALALAVVVITWIMNQAASGQLVLPAVAVTVLTLVKTAIGILSDAATTSSTAEKRGFAPVKLVFALAVAGFLFGAIAILAQPACNKPLPPNTPGDVSGATECVATELLTAGVAGLASCVLTWGPALVADALQMLLSSSIAKDHPGLVPAMNAKLLELRAGAR